MNSDENLNEIATKGLEVTHPFVFGSDQTTDLLVHERNRKVTENNEFR
jgi:hypothetical protein